MIRLFISAVVMLMALNVSAQSKRSLKPIGKVQALETAVRIDVQTLEKNDGASVKTLRFSAGRIESTGLESHVNEITAQELTSFTNEVMAIQSKTTTEEAKGVSLEYFTETKDGFRFSAYTQVGIWKYALQFRDPDGSRYIAMLDAKDVNDFITYLKAASLDF